MAVDLTMAVKGKVAMPPRIVLYGVEGIGKSSFAAEAQETIFISTEGGLDNIDASKLPLCESYAAVMEQLDAIHTQKHAYKTLAIDTLDWMEKLIWQKVCKDRGVNSIEDIGYAKGYIFAMDLWHEFIQRLDLIRNKTKMPIILLAHENIRRFDSPQTEPYDRYELKLHAKAAALFYEWADAVLFANYKPAVAKADLGFKKEVNRGIGGGDRYIFTEERPAYKAKNRYNLPTEIPFIKDQGWSAFTQAMAANFTQKQEGK